jgi:SnoaL-like domain
VTDAADAARLWAATWQRCWEAGDPEPILALYAPEATFWSQPFREPDRGRTGLRRYVERAFASESGVRARFGEPIVAGRRAAVSWWAELDEDGTPITLAGTSVLTFDDADFVIEQWDAWNEAEGRRPPGDPARFARRDT